MALWTDWTKFENFGVFLSKYSGGQENSNPNPNPKASAMMLTPLIRFHMYQYW